MSDKNLVELTAHIVSAQLSGNNVALTDVPKLIQTVHDVLAGLGAAPRGPEKKPEPAVPVRTSVHPDYIVCLEDGLKRKMLRRHLMTRYQMSPEQYRAKWNLPRDYPMTAPNYAAVRSTLARKSGLGGNKRRPSGSDSEGKQSR